MIQVLNAKFKRLHKNAHPPLYATERSAGMDIFACLDEPVNIANGQWEIIPTGIAIALPVGYEGQVRPRSGLAGKHGITVLNSPGTLDSDYRGELKVILYNAGSRFYTVSHMDRIAQLVIAPVHYAFMAEAEELDDTERGEGGFGSTGK